MIDRPFFLNHRAQHRSSFVSAAAQVCSAKSGGRAPFMASAGAEADAGEAPDDSGFEMDLIHLPVTGGGPPE